ncbi:MAG: sugar-binding transcriptional regulator [Anaerolineales bacterium]|nr:MAG: sugar-binding transcriptional regulator [Anaerolineales bacterium]
MAKTTHSNYSTDLENLEFLARIANLYYEEGYTQQRISEELGYSRSAISRFLTAAREAGVVEIKIHYPMRRNDKLEAELRKRFKLDIVRVLIRNSVAYPRMLNHLGALGARIVEEHIRESTTLGVSWGTAVFEVANNLRSPHLPDSTVIQLIGALGTPDPQIDGGELVRFFARSLGGRYRILPAPAIVDSPDVRDALMNDRPVRETLDLARQMDLAVVGIGTTNPSMSSLVRAQYLTEDEVRPIAKSGAVGDVCAIHFDIDGNVLDIPIARRVVGIRSEDLKKVPLSIAVAGGEVKAPAIRGALRSGLVNALVTDDEAARIVLTIDEERV